MTTLFDAYVFVDWSAASGRGPARPSRDAVWIGELSRDRTLERATYHRTRASAARHVDATLASLVAAGRRVLVGFDFSLGYPAGLASLLPARDAAPPWRRIWSELCARIEDGEDNRNNRFLVAAALNAEIGRGRPGPFWGCPSNAKLPSLAATSPGFPWSAPGGRLLARLRMVEARLRGTQEAWKLLGVGSVGSQALVGIPRVAAIRSRADWAPICRVWPFETGFTATPSSAAGPFIVLAEMWPGLVEDAVARLVEELPSRIRDEAQVRATCAWAHRLDAAGLLGRCFDAPDDLDARELAVCVAEEGWVVGA